MSLSRIILVITMVISGCVSAGGQGSDPESGASNPSELATGTVSGTISSTGPSSVIELRYDETVTHQELEFRWLTLDDSRCPTGINCVWGGQMLATVEITHDEQGKKEVELLRGAGREPEVSSAFSYELRLQGVFPHPKANVTPKREDYIMRFEISTP